MRYKWISSLPSYAPEEKERVLNFDASNTVKHYTWDASTVDRLLYKASNFPGLLQINQVLVNDKTTAYDFVIRRAVCPTIFSLSLSYSDICSKTSSLREVLLRHQVVAPIYTPECSSLTDDRKRAAVQALENHCLNEDIYTNEHQY